MWRVSGRPVAASRVLFPGSEGARVHGVHAGQLRLMGDGSLAQAALCLYEHHHAAAQRPRHQALRLPGVRK
eukprot:gene23466-biopygen1259